MRKGPLARVVEANDRHRVEGMGQDMWAQLIKVVSLSKGALVVGVAASAAMVSSAESSTTPSHHFELPSATPLVSVTPPASPRTETRTSGGGLPHGELPAVVKECVAKYLAIREQGDGASDADRQSVKDTCQAALTSTGLSSGEFWAKFGLNDQRKTEPKSEPKNPDLEAALKECVSQYLAGTADQSDACREAIAASGLSPQEFWTKFGAYADQVKNAPSDEALHMAQECVTKYNAKSPDASVTCKKAIELSGLTSAEFAAKFLQHSTETKPSSTPSATRPATAEFEQLVYHCRKLRGAITETAPSEQVNAAGTVCEKAIAASGLAATDFWNRWPAIKPTTKPATTPKPETKPTNTAEAAQLAAKCLDM